MPNNSKTTRRVVRALHSRFQIKPKVARATVTSIQADGTGRAIGAVATIDGLPNQKVYIDIGANYQEGDVLEVVNDGGAASPVWYSRRRLSTTVPVPTIQVNPTLPTPTGLDATHTEDGVTAALLVTWITVDPAYGDMMYDIHVRANDPELYDQTFTVRDDKVESELQADITSSGDAIPHEMDSDDDLPEAGRVLVDAELIDYTVATYGTGDTGTGTGSTNTLTDGSKSWTVDEWINWALIDSAGTVFKITDSAATTLTVSGTPASGAYEICPALTGLTRAAGSTTAAAHSETAPIYVKTEYLRLSGLNCMTYNIRARSHRVIDDTVSVWTSTITEIAEDSVAPDEPTDFVAHSGYGAITFTWEPPSDSDLAGYKIYKATSIAGAGAVLYKTVGLVSSVTVEEDPGTYGFFNIKAYDYSENESGYGLAASSWDFAVSAFEGAGQILTNADWEIGDTSVDNDIQDWWYEETLTSGYPNFDYQATGGIFNSKSIIGATTAPGQQGYATLLWPDPLTAIKVPGVPGAAYAVSIYVKKTGAEEITPLLYIGSHDGSSNMSFVTDATTVLWKVDELADGWERYTKVSVWDGTYDYIAVQIQLDAYYLLGVSTAIIDRPQLEIGLAATEWSLVGAPVGDSSGIVGLRLDTTGIIGDNLAIDLEGLIGSDLDPSADDTYSLGGTNRWDDVKYGGDLLVTRSGDQYTGKVILASGYETTTSDVTLSTSAQVMISKTVTIPAGCTLRLWGQANFAASSFTAANVVMTYLYVKSGYTRYVAQHILGGIWITSSQVYQYTAATEESVTFSMRVYKSDTNNTIVCEADYTSLMWDIIG